MLDYDVQRCTRRCAATDRELKPGEPCFSALVPRGATVVRLDFAHDAWPGPPDQSLGWWRSRVPDGGKERVAWAPNEVMLDYFAYLADRPEKADLRYVLALLLIRRRVIRHENTLVDDAGRETLVVVCPQEDTEYESRLAAETPDEPRIAEIQAELSKLLFGDAASLMPDSLLAESPALHGLLAADPLAEGPLAEGPLAEGPLAEGPPAEGFLSESAPLAGATSGGNKSGRDESGRDESGREKSSSEKRAGSGAGAAVSTKAGGAAWIDA
jgi:hypothetical protein